MSLFLGDNSRRGISLRGASKREGRDELLERTKKQREERQAQKRRDKSALTIQVR